MRKVLIRNANVVDPGQDFMGLVDLLIEGEFILEMAEHISLPEDSNVRVINVEGALTVPGFIDLQVNPGWGIEHICPQLLFSGITTPLIMSSNVQGRSYLEYYENLESILMKMDGQPTNVASSISIQPEDTDLYETYKDLSIKRGTAETRVKEFQDLGITAIGEVVLPLGGTAHVSSNMSEEFLDELLDATEKYNYPVLLHTGLGTDGVLEAIRIANGRKVHICHVGSTVSGGDLHRVLSAIEKEPNVTCDTHLSPMAGSNSRKSDLLRHYHNQGNAFKIDPESLETRLINDLDKDQPPFYYSKENLLENNIICAMSNAVDAIESDDLGEGVRAKLMTINVLNLLSTAKTEVDKKKLLLKLIGKMTSKPAQILQLEKRGSLRPGNYADITIFDQSMKRVNTVFVNGQLALNEGKLTGVKAGKHLSRKV